MRRLIRHLLLLVLIGCAPTDAAQVAAPGKDATARLRGKLLDAAYIEGRFTKIADEGRFTFQYTHQIKKTNPKEYARFNEIVRQFNAALLRRSTSLETLRKLREQGRAAQKAAYTVEETPVLFDLQGAKGLAIRRLSSPTDAEGKPRSLTPAEQKEMRRVRGVPGYPADPKELTTDVRVRVYLDRNKARAAAKGGEEAVLPLVGIVIVPEPKEKDPFVIPGE